MWSNRPTVPIQNNMTKKSKRVPQEDGKNCLSPKFIKAMCSDKNCQENISMQSEMPEMNMQSPKPAITRLCSDKNCQSTSCYRKKESSETNA